MKCFTFDLSSLERDRLKTYSIDITDFQVDDRNKSNVKIKLELLSTMLSDYNKLISKLRL